MGTENNLKSKGYKRLAMFLTALVLANPLMLYLLSERLSVTLIGFIGTVLIVLQLDRLRKSWEWVAVYALNFLILLSVCFHAEVVFRYVFQDYHIENLYELHHGYYFNKPFLKQHFIDKEFEVDYVTNHNGLRIGQEMNPEDTFSRADWLFIGDSYTQGAQVDFHDLYTTKLYKRFPNKVIVNAGISGFGLPEEHDYYLREGKKYRASKVFLQLCSFNDFMQVASKTYGFSDYLMDISELARYLLYDFKYVAPGELPLGRWSEPFYPTEKENRLYNIFYEPSSDQKRQDSIQFCSFLSNINSAVQEQGAELIVILIPTKEQVKFKYFEEVVNEFGIPVEDLDMGKPNRIVQSLSDSLGFRFIDLLHPFSAQQDDLFYDFDEHLNRKGHEFMAAVIAAQMDEIPDEPKLLSNQFCGDRYPSIVDSGNHILFQSFRDGNMEIFIADSLLQNEVRLTFNEVSESHPSMTADGKHILFTEGDQSQMQTNVVIMNSQGKERSCFTNGRFQFGSIPSVSSDGNKIAIAEWEYDTLSQDYSTPRMAIYELEQKHLLTRTNDSVEHWRPVFSPSGDKLVYIAKKFGNFDLFELDLNTGEEKPLTRTPFDEWDPNYSPDGRRLIYSAHKDGNWDLFLLAEDNPPIQLTKTLGDEWDASFQPNGRSLIYSGRFGYYNGIYTMDIE